MGKIIEWWRRVVNYLFRGTLGQRPLGAGLQAEPAPPLTIYPYTVPVQWEAYLEAWQQAMQTDWGKRLAAMLSQNYAKDLMQTCPPTLRTIEERVVWQAAHDAKKELWGGLLTAATENVKLLSRPAVKKGLPPS